MNEESNPVGWAQVPAQRREHIEAGAKALARIDKKRDFHDWYLVGMALFHLRETAREQSGAESGRGYNMAYAQCIADNPKLRPLADIDDATRTNAVWLAINWGEVSKWHDDLKAHNSRLVNHPAAVRHRYNLDHPQLPQTRDKAEGPAKDEDAEDIENAEDEDNNDIDDEDIYDLEGPAHTVSALEMEPIDEPETAEAMITAFEALWLRMTVEVRDEIANRIVRWMQDRAEHAEAMHGPDTVMVDTAVAATNKAVNKSAGVQVRNLSRRKKVTVTTGQPTQEALAMAVMNAENTPLAEDEDPFPASTNLGPITRH